jgi:hypothetical protein
MLGNTATMTARSPADTTPTRRRIQRIDGRSKAAKRAKALAAGFIAQIGSGADDAATLAAVQKAAELVVVSEAMRARALRGESVDLSELVKVQGVADRGVRALNLPKQLPPDRIPILSEYLAAHDSERGKAVK